MIPNVPSRQLSAARLWLAGAVVLLLVAIAAWVAHAIVTGQTRRAADAPPPVSGEEGPEASSTMPMLVRRQLDGLLVAPEAADLRPWAFMIDNQIDARPALGVEAASVVVEAPVEGGITRLLALFDPLATSTLRIGAVRSARPYFVDWAASWKAVYGHVGGSPDALEKLSGIASTTLLDANEMTRATSAFRRDPSRVSPHQVVTTPARFTDYLGSVASSSVRYAGWRYLDAPAASSTAVEAPSVRVPYGGSYTVRWTYEAERGAYRRIQAGAALSSEPIYAANVVVIKTDGQILDEKGRLRLRTTGGGEAFVYRDGRKLIGRWSRSTGDVIRFTTADGTDIELRAGTTWIEVTTDDRVFAGLDQAQ